MVTGCATAARLDSGPKMRFGGSIGGGEGGGDGLGGGSGGGRSGGTGGGAGGGGEKPSGGAGVKGGGGLGGGSGLGDGDGANGGEPGGTSGGGGDGAVTAIVPVTTLLMLMLTLICSLSEAVKASVWTAALTSRTLRSAEASVSTVTSSSVSLTRFTWTDVTPVSRA